MPGARAAFTDPGVPGDRRRMVVLKVRVAMGTALPGFLVPAIRANFVGRSFASSAFED